MKRKTFDECINNNQLIETGDRDIDMVKELLTLAKHREEFWKNSKNKEEQYPSLFIEGHYEIIKELCTAILILDGWKALNHECLFSYLKNKKNEPDIDINYLLELKDLRNSIDYRGVMVSSDTWKQNKLKIQMTIKALKEYIENKLEN